ncbi:MULTISPECIES: acyl carrier protein [unclassified Streptomyces]|uniref:acyl carrier protein n=1 Tax=unclassified Streptomyces TaxID=2593676 RepID=UPI003244C2F5
MNHDRAEPLLPLVIATAGEIFGDQVEPNQDFFGLGGDSVTAVWFADRLEERLGIDVDVRVVTESESFAVLADRLTGMPAAAVRAIGREG